MGRISMGGAPGNWRGEGMPEDVRKAIVEALTLAEENPAKWISVEMDDEQRAATARPSIVALGYEAQRRQTRVYVRVPG